MEQRVTVLEVEVQHLREDNQQILEQLKAIEGQLQRYKGAWGALVMVGSAVAVCVTLALKYFGK